MIRHNYIILKAISKPVSKSTANNRISDILYSTARGIMEGSRFVHKHKKPHIVKCLGKLVSVIKDIEKIEEDHVGTFTKS